MYSASNPSERIAGDRQTARRAWFTTAECGLFPESGTPSGRSLVREPASVRRRPGAGRIRHHV